MSLKYEVNVRYAKSRYSKTHVIIYRTYGSPQRNYAPCRLFSTGQMYWSGLR